MNFRPTDWLVTTWPCVVEASYLLGTPHRFEMLRGIELGGAVIYPFETRHLGDIIAWMRRYTTSSKREMDLADASLYWLAVETGTTDIMTIDAADFTRYRLPDRKRFSLALIIFFPRRTTISACSVLLHCRN